MEKSEDQTDEDETEWESSFEDPVPFEASAAAAGSWKPNQEYIVYSTPVWQIHCFSSAFYSCQSVILTCCLGFRSKPQ